MGMFNKQEEHVNACTFFFSKVNNLNFVLMNTEGLSFLGYSVTLFFKNDLSFSKIQQNVTEPKCY